MSDGEAAAGEAIPETFREDIALLAMNALPADEAAALEQRLQDNPEGRKLLGIYKSAMDVVKREQRPEKPIGTDTVLAKLRHRIAAETQSRPAVSAVPDAPPPARPGLWMLIVGAAVLGAMGVAAFLVQPEDPRPGVNPGPAEKVALGTVHLPPGSATKLKSLHAGDRYTAVEDGQRVDLGGGVRMFLRAGATARMVDKTTVEITEGEAALFVPGDAPEAWRFRAVALAVRAREGAAARFGIEVADEGEGAGEGEVEVAVAEGAVEVIDRQDSKAAATAISAGQARTWMGDEDESAGEPGGVERIDPKRTFGWVAPRHQKDLELTLQVENDGRTVLSIRNAGDRALAVAGFHPLGVNYQLQVTAAGEKQPGFEKVAPQKLRKRVAPDIAYDMEVTKRDVVLEPGQAFELELSLKDTLKGRGPWKLAGHYLGFVSEDGDSSSDARAGGWGFTLRSAEIVHKGAPKP